MANLFCSPAAWRKDCTSTLLLSACQLAESDLTDEQHLGVHVILYQAIRLHLQAQQESRPGIWDRVFFPFRTWHHRQEISDYADAAWDLAERMIRSPRDWEPLMSELERHDPRTYKRAGTPACCDPEPEEQAGDDCDDD